DLLGFLRSDQAREHGGAEAAVEGAYARSRLTEARVLSRDREVADHVQHVPAADRVAGHHGPHGLGQPADLDVQVAHLKPPARLVPAGLRWVGARHIAAALAPHPLIA